MLLHYGCYLSSGKSEKGKISLYLDRHTQKDRRRFAKTHGDTAQQNYFPTK